MLIIRQTKLEDAQGVAACVDSVARERHFLATTEGFTTEQTQAYIQFLQGSGGIHHLVQDENTIVGWCDITPGSFEGLTHAGRLGMGLLPNYRGQGLGNKLLASALQAAFQSGLEKIELDVFASNTGAIHLYRHAGFIEEGCKRKARKLDDRYDDILLFGLFRENIS